MAGDFNKPATTDAYAVFASAVRDLAADLAKGLDPAVVSTANIPTNAIRWNSAQNRDEIYNGSAWVVKSALYSINISGNAATATAADAVPWSGISSKPTTISGYGITDMASQTVDKASHLVGGAVGAIPYQTGAGATAMLTAGTSGYVLKANGNAAPTWVAQSTLSVGVAASCSGNAATATTAAACSGNAATATAATNANNLAGGGAGYLPWQSSAGVTAMLGAGVSGYVLTSGGGGSPGWTAQSSLNVGLLGGIAASGFATAGHTHADVPKDFAAGNYPVGMWLQAVVTTGPISAGVTTIGSNLTPTWAGATTLPGTWRNLGYSVNSEATGVFQRIS